MFPYRLGPKAREKIGRTRLDHTAKPAAQGTQTLLSRCPCDSLLNYFVLSFIRT